MKVPVQIAAKDDARAWDILVRHSLGIALPNRTFVIPEAAVRALHKAGIKFRLLLQTEQHQLLRRHIDDKLLEALGSGRSTSMAVTDWKRLRKEGRKRISRKRKAQ